MKRSVQIVSWLLCVLLIFCFTACSETETKRLEKESMKMQLVPTPKTVNNSGKAMLYKTTVRENEEFAEAIDAFVDYASRLEIDFTKDKKGDFLLSKDDTLQSGAYRLAVSESGVMLAASDETGMQHAFATVLQLMEKADGGVYLPVGEITDSADCEYRGMMVDLARNWHDFSYLLSYVDMCYYYKISVLHLHFTDDQSYTLPSALYPELSTEGRHYTREQIAELVAYAKARGVELMPEIDVPGHCKSFEASYHRIFGTTGIICQHQESMDAMQALFKELCEMFPNSKYIHIGGDEAAIANWANCSKCRKYAQSVGIDASIEDKELLSQQMYANFVNKMAEAVLDCGKKPVAWEGFSKEVNGLVSKEILMMSWENYYQTTPDLLDGGFEILNCSWNPMYVVTPVHAWPLEDLYSWSIYKWKAVHPQSPYLHSGLQIEPNERVRGGQLLAWGDQIAASYEILEDGIRAERELLLERLPFLAENTWNVQKLSEYKDLLTCCKAQGERLKKIIQ